MRRRNISSFALLIGFLLALLVVPAVSYSAGPYLVFDAQTGVTSYKVTGPAWVPTTPVAAQPDGSLKMDVSAATIGTSNLTVQGCWTDAIWGEQCSSTVPFTFTRPGKPLAPTGGKLVP
jgi:hypothetical protein